MTDNEIIKAFKCCQEGAFEKCDECPLRVPGKEDIFTCLSKKQELVFDLINRQKAEIERLEKEITEYKPRMEMLSNTVNEIKFETIKEFAERLKENMRLEDGCKYDCEQCCYECKEYVPIIDNLVKEMTEAEENEM